MVQVLVGRKGKLRRQSRRAVRLLPYKYWNMFMSVSVFAHIDARCGVLAHTYIQLVERY